MCFYLVSCWCSHDNECGLVSNLCQRKGVKHMSASFCICSSNHGESWKKIEYFLACDHGVCQVPKSNDNMLYLYPCQAQGLMFTSTWSQSVYALPCQAQGLHHDPCEGMPTYQGQCQTRVKPWTKWFGIFLLFFAVAPQVHDTKVQNMVYKGLDNLVTMMHHVKCSKLNPMITCSICIHVKPKGFHWTCQAKPKGLCSHLLEAKVFMPCHAKPKGLHHDPYEGRPTCSMSSLSWSAI